MHSGHMQSPVQAEAMEASLSCSLLCFSYVSLVADVGVGGISLGAEEIGWPAHCENCQQHSYWAVKPFGTPGVTMKQEC